MPDQNENDSPIGENHEDTLSQDHLNIKVAVNNKEVFFMYAFYKRWRDHLVRTFPPQELPNWMAKSFPRRAGSVVWTCFVSSLLHTSRQPLNAYQC